MGESFAGLMSRLLTEASGTFLGAALDTETSGLSSASDHIIEIGIQLFSFDLPEGRVGEVVEEYTALQDPGFVMSPESQRITGLTPLALAGQSIDWARVDALLERVDIVVAHNAAFDRAFVERKSRVSASKLWGCSSFQIDWRGKGFANARLQDICASLGIAFEAHRAMSDVRAMVKLIGSQDAFTGKPYLAELLADTRVEMAWLWVEGKTYDQRDLLKAHGFRWNGDRKIWGKLVKAEDEERLSASVRDLIPGTTVRSQRVAPIERFK